MQISISLILSLLIFVLVLRNLEDTLNYNKHNYKLFVTIYDNMFTLNVRKEATKRKQIYL